MKLGAYEYGMVEWSIMRLCVRFLCMCRIECISKIASTLSSYISCSVLHSFVEFIFTHATGVSCLCRGAQVWYVCAFTTAVAKRPVRKAKQLT